MPYGHVIGLGSLPGAGKGELAKQLSGINVEHLHVGTIVRSMARYNGFIPAEETREAYLPFWTEYSKKHGPDWLARTAFQLAEASERCVLLDGVRIPADAEAIAKADNGTMVWLECDPRIVARRVLSRGRIEDMGISSIDDYVARMQEDLDGTGNFSMGAVRDASEIFLLPVPEIDNQSARVEHYRSLAKHLLDVCGLSLDSTK